MSNIDLQEKTAKAVVDAAFLVHKEMGPGLLESVYEECMHYALQKSGALVARQVLIPLIFQEQKLENDFRLDMLVNDCVVVEIKASKQNLPIFEAQLLNYMKLAKKDLGILLNFHLPLMKDGIKRIILR